MLRRKEKLGSTNMFSYFVNVTPSDSIRRNRSWRKFKRENQTLNTPKSKLNQLERLE